MVLRTKTDAEFWGGLGGGSTLVRCEPDLRLGPNSTQSPRTGQPVTGKCPAHRRAHCRISRKCIPRQGDCITTKITKYRHQSGARREERCE